MRILAIDIPREGVNPADYAPHLFDEIKHGWQLIKSDLIREMYSRKDHPGVIIVFEAESMEDAGFKTVIASIKGGQNRFAATLGRQPAQSGDRPKPHTDRNVQAASLRQPQRYAHPAAFPIYL